MMKGQALPSKKNVGQASFSGSVDWSHLIKYCEHAYKIFYLERA